MVIEASGPSALPKMHVAVLGPRKGKEMTVEQYSYLKGKAHCAVKWRYAKAYSKI